MDFDRFGKRSRLFGQRFRGFVLKYRVHNVVFNQQFVIGGKHIAQNQNGVFYPGAAQLYRFFNGSDAERVSADFL